MTELLTAIGTLAIILIGIGVTLQMISSGDAIGFVGRGVVALVLAILALCILKGLWVGSIAPWLSAAFAFLTTLIGWSVIAVLGVLALLILGRVAVRRFGWYLTLRRDPLTGDRNETDDSKEEQS